MVNKNTPMNGNRIKEIRLSQHKTQKDLAKLLNVSEQAIAYYEKALREPPLKTWVKLAKYFGVSVSYLTGVSGEPTSNSNRLKAVRQDKGMSYQQVADAYNQEADRLSVFDHQEQHISAKTVQSIETGNYQPSQHEWQLLAWGLNVPQFYLAGQSNDKVGWQEWAKATGYSVEQLKSEVKRLVDTGRLDSNSDKQHQISYAVESLDGRVPTSTHGVINGVQDKLMDIKRYIGDAFIVSKYTPLSPGSEINYVKPGDSHIRSDMDEKAYNQLLNIIDNARYEIAKIRPNK